MTELHPPSSEAILFVLAVVGVPGIAALAALVARLYVPLIRHEHAALWPLLVFAAGAVGASEAIVRGTLAHGDLPLVHLLLGVACLWLGLWGMARNDVRSLRRRRRVT